MVGGADVSFTPHTGVGIWMLTVRPWCATLRFFRNWEGAKTFRGGKRRLGHAPVGACTSTKVPNVGVHSVNSGITDRSDCWMDGDIATEITFLNVTAYNRAICAASAAT